MRPRAARSKSAGSSNHVALAARWLAAAVRRGGLLGRGVRRVDSHGSPFVVGGPRGWPIEGADGGSDQTGYSTPVSVSDTVQSRAATAVSSDCLAGVSRRQVAPQWNGPFGPDRLAALQPQRAVAA